MKPQDTPVDETRSGPPSPRKPYVKPELQVYGDLTEITAGLAAMTGDDGTGHKNKHFTS